MKFKNFLITEQEQYFSHKVGDVLTSVHELIRGGKQIGARLLVRHSEGVANQIRRILHSSWPKSEWKYLKVLQKCGVALMKCIDEKGDLQDTLNSVRAEVEKLTGKLGMPVNNLGSQNKEEPAQPAQPSQDEPAQNSNQT